jgi:hypothetical protein
VGGEVTHVVKLSEPSPALPKPATFGYEPMGTAYTELSPAETERGSPVGALAPPAGVSVPSEARPKTSIWAAPA